MQHRHESVLVSITAVSSRRKSIGTICSRLIYEQIVNYFLSYIVPLLSSTDIYISIWPFNYCCSNFIEFIASKGKEWKAKFSILSPNYSNIHSGSFIPKFGRRDRIYEGRDGGMEKGEGNNFAWKCIGNRIQLPPPSLERIAERKLWTFGFTPGRCLRIIRHYVIDIGYWAGIYRVLRDRRFMNNSSTINCNLKRDMSRPRFTIVSFIIGMLCVSRLVPRV